MKSNKYAKHLYELTDENVEVIYVMLLEAEENTDCAFADKEAIREVLNKLETYHEESKCECGKECDNPNDGWCSAECFAKREKE